MMNNPDRYIPEWPFPKYQFVPGKNPHPKKVGGHMEGEGDPVADQIDPVKPFENKFLRYALDLFNHGYYWESHVYFEALWNAHNREGSVADFCKGMIKLGAAGVKKNINQTTAVLGHLERAKELIEAVKAQEGAHFLNFNLDIILQSIDENFKYQTINMKVFKEKPLQND